MINFDESHIYIREDKVEFAAEGDKLRGSELGYKMANWLGKDAIADDFLQWLHKNDLVTFKKEDDEEIILRYLYESKT